MVQVKEAVVSAKDFLSRVMLEAEDWRLEDLRLEEIELSDDERFWLVTLSYGGVAYASTMAAQIAALTGEKPRGYKLVKVDATTGRAVGMKKAAVH